MDNKKDNRYYLDRFLTDLRFIIAHTADLEQDYSSFIRRFCRGFSAKYPEIDLRYDIMTANTPAQIAAEHDFFFTPCESPNIHNLLIRQHGTELVLPPNHPMMPQQTVYLHQLSDQTIIVPHAGELFGPYAKNYLLAEKATKGQVFAIKVDSLPTALFLSQMGKGVCIAPDTPET